MKKIVIYLTIILVLAIIVITWSGRNHDEVIKIGYVGPLTGEAAPYGQSVLDGIRLAISNAEKRGMIKAGTIEIVAEDGKCSGVSAVGATEKLIQVDHVQVIFGGQCSGETMAMSPITEKNGVVILSSFSTSPDISKAGDYIFRLPPSDELAGKYIAETIAKDGVKKVGLLSENTQASQTIIPVFEKNSKDLGMNVVLNSTFNSDSRDYRQVVSSVISENPEAIYMNVQTGGVGARIVKSLRELGYKNQIYTYYITGDEFVKSGSYVNGVKIIDFRAALDSNDLVDFMSNFKNLYEKDPAYPMAATLGYDSGVIILKSIEKKGNNSNGIKQYLYSMPVYKGITGNITFDSNGDSVGTGLYYVRQVVDNKLVDIK